jgi:hypothetical protein
MAFRAGLLNFSKGEIAEELIARVDVPSYNASLKTARNVIVLKYGGVTKRPGTHMVAPVYAGDARLFPFQFSLTQAYALELGQGYMRLCAFGGLVLETPLVVTGITAEAQAIVTTATPHGYNPSDQVYFNDVKGMTEINGRFGNVVASIDATHFRVDINTSGFTAFGGDSGGDPSPPPVTQGPHPQGNNGPQGGNLA